MYLYIRKCMNPHENLHCVYVADLMFQFPLN